MKTTLWTIKGAFGLIGEIFDELSHEDRAWKACGCGESVRETIEIVGASYSRFSNNSKCGGARDEKGRFVDRAANVGMAHG